MLTTRETSTVTMMVHYLAALPEKIDLQQLDQSWRSHVIALQEFSPLDWACAPPWLASRPHKQLDWGTRLYEVSSADIAKLIGRANDELPTPSGRYVAIWVECY